MKAWIEKIINKPIIGAEKNNIMQKIKNEFEERNYKWKMPREIKINCFFIIVTTIMVTFILYYFIFSFINNATKIYYLCILVSAIGLLICTLVRDKKLNKKIEKERVTKKEKDMKVANDILKKIAHEYNVDVNYLVMFLHENYTFPIWTNVITFMVWTGTFIYTNENFPQKSEEDSLLVYYFVLILANLIVNKLVDYTEKTIKDKTFLSYALEMQFSYRISEVEDKLVLKHREKRNK